MPKVIMLIGIICLTWVQALGQSTLLDIKISVRAEKQSIQKVLEQIEQELQITFSYFGGDSLLNKKITLVAENETLNNILDKVLLSNQMHYQVIGRQIVLKKSHLVDTKIAKENTKVSHLSLITASGFFRIPKN
jgi:iron complex outermembrane receptor protein